MKAKIRFVEDKNSGNFLIQKKGLFGWHYIKYEVTDDDSTWENKYMEKSKETLFDIVLDEHFKTTLTNIWITEYPTIKIY